MYSSNEHTSLSRFHIATSLDSCKLCTCMMLQVMRGCTKKLGFRCTGAQTIMCIEVALQSIIYHMCLLHYWQASVSMRPAAQLSCPGCTQPTTPCNHGLKQLGYSLIQLQPMYHVAERSCHATGDVHISWTCVVPLHQCLHHQVAHSFDQTIHALRVHQGLASRGAEWLRRACM